MPVSVYRCPSGFFVTPHFDLMLLLCVCVHACEQNVSNKAMNLIFEGWEPAFVIK